MHTILDQSPHMYREGFVFAVDTELQSLAVLNRKPPFEHNRTQVVRLPSVHNHHIADYA
jgi:hypothetical protein